MRVHSITTNSVGGGVVDAEQPPALAILSHAINSPVSGKIQSASEVAIRYGATSLWEFSLCIDHTSNLDVDLAVTQSYSRLRSAVVCLVYLHDLPTQTSCADEKAWRSCRYWTRAWPLAEFVVPNRVEIYDCQWNHRGSKGSSELISLLSDITSIPKGVLQNPETMLNTPAGMRLSWGSNKCTSQPEDAAYALMPVLGITIPTRYGEGANEAFLRLQRSFLQRSLDASILFWRHGQQGAIDALLAQSPAEFSGLHTMLELDLQAGPSSNGVPTYGIPIRPREAHSGDLPEGDQSLLKLTDIAVIKRKRASSPVAGAGTGEDVSEMNSDNLEQDTARWSDEFSDSDSDSDCSCHCHSHFYSAGEVESETFQLDPSHELQEIRPDLLEFAHELAQRNLEAASYSAPPDDRLPPQKRIRRAGWGASDEISGQATGPEEKKIQDSSGTRGYFHLACPFYVYNPKRYQWCILQHDLQTMGDVIRHVSEHHAEPPYCPICRQEFERAFTRDVHVRERTCTPSTGEVDGVNDRQRRMLAKKDKIELGERRRWMRMWRTVFPSRKPEGNPYLDSGLGLKISILGDYWESRGYDVVMEFLSKFKKPDCFQLREIKAISQICLEDMIKRLAREDNLSSDSSNTV